MAAAATPGSICGGTSTGRSRGGATSAASADAAVDAAAAGVAVGAAAAGARRTLVGVGLGRAPRSPGRRRPAAGVPGVATLVAALRDLNRLRDEVAERRASSSARTSTECGARTAGVVEKKMKSFAA